MLVAPPAPPRWLLRIGSTRARLAIALVAAILTAVVPGSVGAQSDAPPPRASVGWSAALARQFAGIVLTPAARGEVMRTRASYRREMLRVRDSARAATVLDDEALALRLASLAREEEAAFRAILPLAARARYDENLVVLSDTTARADAQPVSRRAPAGGRGTRRPPP